MKKIDVNGWERKSHYEWFSSFSDPSVAIDVRVDVSKMIEYCKQRGVSSFATLLYIVCKSLNETPALRLRILRGEVVELDYANAAYTALGQGRAYVNAHLPMNVSLSHFLENFEREQRRVKEGKVQAQFNDLTVVDNIYCTCSPWISFLSIRQPMPDKSEENMSIPRVAWGRYETEGDKTTVVVNLTANHALVDGIDLGDAFAKIQQYCNQVETFD